MDLLECRDRDGKTAFFCAVEHDREEIIEFLLDTYESLDIGVKDTYNGDTVLHVAVRNMNINVINKIVGFSKTKDLCLVQNLRGETPVFTATQVSINIDEPEKFLDIFLKYKTEALQLKD